MQKEGQWQALDVLQEQRNTLNKGLLCISACLYLNDTHSGAPFQPSPSPASICSGKARLLQAQANTAAPYRMPSAFVLTGAATGFAAAGNITE